MFRLLATEVFWHGGVRGCSIVTVEEDRVSVEPFERELHSTVFIPGTIAVLDSLKFDEFVADDIEMILTATNSVADKKKLDDYLQSSSLYYNCGCGQPLLLKLGRPCQIIPIN